MSTQILLKMLNYCPTCVLRMEMLLERIFCVLMEYLKNGDLQWKSCVGICTDGAAAIVRRNKGFKERNPNVILTHCF